VYEAGGDWAERVPVGLKTCWLSEMDGDWVKQMVIGLNGCSLNVEL
jgi:hypothetical protein